MKRRCERPAERWRRRRSAARRRCARGRRASSRRPRAGDSRAAAQRKERRPRSRQAAAERAGIDGRPFDRRQARHERRAARLGDRVFERAARSERNRRCAVRARTRRDSPTAGWRRPAAPSCRAARAPSPSQSRDRDGRRRPSIRPAPAAGRCRAGPDAGPARSRRRSPARCCPDAPIRRQASHPRARTRSAFSSGACAPMSASTATTAAAALAALPPSPLESGSPLTIAERHAAALAERRQQRLRRDAGGVARRLARQPAVVAGDGVDVTAPPVGRARESRRHLIAGRVQREPEHVEAARDVRHGRRRKRSDERSVMAAVPYRRGWSGSDTRGRRGRNRTSD